MKPLVREVQASSDEAVTVVPEEQIVVAYVEPVVETPLPLPSPQAPRFALKGFVEQTPTTLGMAIEIDEAETPFASMALMHATVLGAAALVEEHSAAVIHAPVHEIPRFLAPDPAEPSPVATTTSTTTRADDLLATFAVSGGDEAAMRETTDGLKKLAGLEPTPPPLAVAPPAPEPKRVAPATTPQPPVAVAVAPKAARAIPAAVTPPAPKAQPALDALHRELEEEGQAPRKRARPGLSLFAALLAGAVVGLFAVTRLRPDLVPSFEDRVGPALGADHAAPAAVPARVR